MPISNDATTNGMRGKKLPRRERKLPRRPVSSFSQILCAGRQPVACCGRRLDVGSCSKAMGKRGGSSRWLARQTMTQEMDNRCYVKNITSYVKKITSYVKKITSYVNFYVASVSAAPQAPPCGCCWPMMAGRCKPHGQRGAPHSCCGRAISSVYSLHRL